jgi:hypothetical protein
MKTLVGLRSFFLPASIGLLLLVAAGMYNLVWLPSEHRYLDNRNFRLLTTLSEQISASVNNFDKMMDNASDSGITDDMLGSYLKTVAPQLESLDAEDRSIVHDDYGDPPNIAVRADEGTHFLYFAFQRAQNHTKYAVRTDLDKLIRRVLPPDNRNPFDVVLVAQADGTVIFQKSAPGLAVARVDGLEGASEAVKTGKTESEAKPPSKSSKFSFSRFSQVDLAGTRYRVYSQPLPISLPLIDPLNKHAGDGLVQPEPWVLCGLVRAEAFRSESQSISYTYLLLFSVAILLVVAAYPFLRLRVSSCSERLRARDVVVTVVFACAAATTLAFALLDVYYERKEFDQPGPENVMRKLAEAVDANFSLEREKAYQQIRDFYQDETLRKDLNDAQESPEEHPRFSGEEGRCNPLWACRTRILNSIVPERLADYPYLEFAAWSDSKGDQRVKWSTRQHVTPFINLDEASVGYYPAIKKAFAAGSSGGPAAVPVQGIGSQYSPNTGDYITVFWQLLDMHGNLASEKTNMKDVLCASVVTRPISVVDPILPAEFQFAIIQPDGTVVFHSDRTRNLRENFFAETDENQEVRSRVLTRAPGGLVANYMGRGHRLYMHPMALDPTKSWTVIIFRDLRVEETMNLEVLSLASILFGFYALVTVLAVLLVDRPKRRHIAGSWLWPDSRKAEAYKWLVKVNISAILLLLVIPELRWTVVLLFCVVGVAIGALVNNVVVLQRQGEDTNSGDAREQLKSSSWQIGYFATVATLLVAVAVIPCISFFKVAWDFEHRLLIEHSQMRLDADLYDRNERVRSRYLGVDLEGTVKRAVLAEPDDSSKQYFSYHHSFLDTTIDSTQDSATLQKAACNLGSACGQQYLVDSFLSTISPLYNEIAYQSRYLTETSQDKWTSSPTPSKDGEEVKLTKQNSDSKVRTIRSTWTPMQIPWGDGIWWLGALALGAALFGLVRYMLRRVFLLDVNEPRRAGQCRVAVLEPVDLIAKLPVSMVVIGRDSSPTIVNLVRPRQEVQVRDFYQLWNAPMQSAAAAQGGSTSSRSVPSDPVDDIVRDGRPVVFYNFEAGLDDPGNSQRMLSALERVVCRLPKSVVITSRVDPLAKSSGDERQQWQTLLGPFVRIDLNAGPTRRTDETLEQFEARISEEGYHEWLFSGRPETQKLVLVQLAQEKLVNPNSRSDVRALMGEGLVVRTCGMLVIRDGRFAKFLRKAVSHEVVKNWENQGTGHANTLRTSLLVTGLAVGLFFLCTQGAVVNTWITYATGFAAAIPAFLKVLDLIRGGGHAGAPAQ